jgi:hypothetical protein
MEARRHALRHDTNGEVPPPHVPRKTLCSRPVRAWSSVGASKYASCVWERNTQEMPMEDHPAVVYGDVAFLP